jgi:hypothetical protein
MKRTNKKITVVITGSWEQHEELEKAIIFDPSAKWLLEYLREEHRKGKDFFRDAFQVISFGELPRCYMALTVPFSKSNLQGHLKQVASKNPHLEITWKWG